MLDEMICHACERPELENQQDHLHHLFALHQPELDDEIIIWQLLHYASLGINVLSSGGF